MYIEYWIAKTRNINKFALSFVIICLFAFWNNLFAQVYGGCILSEDSIALAFVNIGVVDKDIGTVSDIEGNFSIVLQEKYRNDTLRFSCIGYKPVEIRVADFVKLKNKRICLAKQVYAIKEVIIKPKLYKQKQLGIFKKGKSIQAGYNNLKLGYECGVLMKTRQTTLIEKVLINISRCTYDTLFFRINIYEEDNNQNFKSIQSKPVYFQIPKEKTNETIEIDLSAHNLIVDNDFLVTMEHVKNLGDGELFFCARLLRRSYYRTTSQGAWKTVPAGVSICTIVRVEK